MVFDKILGLEAGLFIFLMVLLGVLILAFIYLFLASVFVGRKEDKIVERFGKEPKALHAGWKLIVPLRDKVVAKVSLAEKIYTNEKPLSIATKTCSFAISYNIVYKVSDSVKFYYSAEKIEQSLENKVAKTLINLLSEKSFDNGAMLYKEVNQDLLSSLNELLEEFGIQATDFVFTSVIKQ